MKHHIIILYILLPILLATSCAEVDLCDSKEHPHSASVSFSYDMSSLSQDVLAHVDTVSIIAYRIVGQWKSLIKIKPNGEGNFIDISHALAEPETATRATTTDDPENTSDTGTQPTGENSDATEPGMPMKEDATIFKVKPGDYKFLTFTMDTTEIDYSEVYRYVHAAAQDQQLADVCVSYKMFNSSDNHLKEQLRNWDDYNSYSQYVQPHQRPIIYDVAPLVPVVQSQNTHVNLKPITKMQNVTVSFDITKKVAKEPFVIDSLWMEISGIPIRINLTNHHLDITKTGKTMSKMQMTAGNGSTSDYMNNTQLRCQASLNINGIVGPIDSQKGANDATRRLSGPGMLQVIIFTHSKELSAITGKPKRKRFQGIINLYNTLANNPSIKITQDGKFAELNGEKCHIHISDNILIDGENIKSLSNEDGGLKNWDKWSPTSKDELIIEI